MATILSDIREMARTMMLPCNASWKAVPLLMIKQAHLEHPPFWVGIEGRKFESHPQNLNAGTARRRNISGWYLSDLLRIEW